MASLGDLLQRIARSLEEAREQGPADDLRARLGYGAEDEDEDTRENWTGWFGIERMFRAGVGGLGPPPGRRRWRTVR